MSFADRVSRVREAFTAAMPARVASRTRTVMLTSSAINITSVVVSGAKLFDAQEPPQGGVLV